MIVRVSVVLRRTVYDDIVLRFDNLSESHHQSMSLNNNGAYCFSPQFAQGSKRHVGVTGYSAIPQTRTQYLLMSLGGRVY